MVSEVLQRHENDPGPTVAPTPLLGTLRRIAGCAEGVGDLLARRPKRPAHEPLCRPNTRAAPTFFPALSRRTAAAAEGATVVGCRAHTATPLYVDQGFIFR